MAKIGIRVWILVIVLAVALLAISPSFKSGVEINSVDKNSTAANEGLKAGMIIKEINSKEIGTVEDYTNSMLDAFKEKKNLTKLVVKTQDNEFVILAERPLEMTVGEIPRTKIKTGLDLSGGSRALVRPVNLSLSSAEISDLVALTSERLNVYGIKDITIKPVRDLEGNNFMLVEVAGASPTELRELVSSQGKFEAKVANQTVFIGGERDITNVCRNDASCARIEQCSQIQDGYACRFSFAVYLSSTAANRHAEITKNISIDQSNPTYLSEKLYLYLDDSEVDSLFISKELKARATTQISIQGSGSGRTQKDAYDDAKASMNKLQTVLLTGSLPYKLEIVKLDTVSPLLGREFTKNIIILAIMGFIAVSIIIFIKYRKFRATLAVILTMASEALITLAIAALIKWNLDAPSIAGIIAGIGTGVDDQIVILDETSSAVHLSMKERIKNSFFIILTAFFTVVVATVPLFWAGAGLVRGFAFTTIIGIAAGILITRPAFAEMIRKMAGD